MCACVRVCVCILSLNVYARVQSIELEGGFTVSYCVKPCEEISIKHFKQACHITGIRIGGTFAWGGTPSLAKMILAFMLASLWRQYCWWNCALDFSVLSSEEILICKRVSACSRDWQPFEDWQQSGLVYTIWISAHKSSSPSDKSLDIL